MEIRLPMLLDGGTGTELQKRGFRSQQSSEEWVLEHPEALIDIQSGYIKAGSQAVMSCTFGASRPKLSQRGLGDKVPETIGKLVAISKEAVKASGKEAYVAGDIGPCGHFLSPLGDLTFEEFYDVMIEQAQALDAAGADYFEVETMMNIPEVRAAILACRKVSDKPVFVSVSCDENGRMLMGTDVIAALLIAQGMGAAAFGLNCSTGPDHMLEQIRRLAPYAKIPLIAKANAGMPSVVGDQTVYDCPPEQYAEYIPQLLDAGASILGGCCGTDVRYIELMKKILDEKSPAVIPQQNEDMLPAATEKDAMFLPSDITVDTICDVNDDFEDDILDVLDEEPEVVGIRIDSDDAAGIWAETQYQVSRPVCFFCEDEELLEKALRAYQGRAMYSGDLDPGFLAVMSDRYGLIVL